MKYLFLVLFSVGLISCSKNNASPTLKGTKWLESVYGNTVFDFYSEDLGSARDKETDDFLFGFSYDLGGANDGYTTFTMDIISGGNIFSGQGRFKGSTMTINALSQTFFLHKLK